MSNRGTAVVLLSGGLDSATVLGWARNEGFDCVAMSFAYGQRHQVELAAARRVATRAEVREHRVVEIDLRAFGGSALTDAIAVPKAGSSRDGAIPITYVPARNTIFLSFGLAWAEVLRAKALCIGVNAVDYSGYPDCRPEFIDAFQTTANLATRAGVEGHGVKLEAPLQHLSKAQIIRRGIDWGVDYSDTLSCYDPIGDLACGECDSCALRRAGFDEAGVPDPTRYRRQ